MGRGDGSVRRPSADLPTAPLPPPGDVKVTAMQPLRKVLQKKGARNRDSYPPLTWSKGVVGLTLGLSHGVRDTCARLCKLLLHVPGRGIIPLQTDRRPEDEGAR